jgi:hypothetical protein
MRPLFLAFLLLFTLAVNAAATTRPAIIFAEEVVAIDADGNRLPSVRIEPQAMAGMQSYDFDLGRERLLRVETNIHDAKQRGLNDLVAAIRRCYSYIETATGRSLERGVLLYLIELDEIPYAYSFQASYDNASQWGEVRLAMIGRDAPLSGEQAPAALSDLLYDTLPHELGHDVLTGIPQLSHDIDGRESQHTRWFIEGVCEILAKGFSQREVPALHRRFLALRSLDTVLADPRMQRAMLNWAQNNQNGLVRESDLYGAAMLSMMIWTESVSLNGLLQELASRKWPVRGSDLVVMLQNTAGLDPQELFARAQAHGRQLNSKAVLARLD